MAALQPFNDLPQIHVDGDSPFWAAFGGDLDNGRCDNPLTTRQANLFCTQGTINGMNSLSSMQRFISGRDSPPFSPVGLNTDIKKSFMAPCSQQTFEFNGYCATQSPWPILDPLQRDPSPDGSSWSQSSGHSINPYSDELQSPISGHRLSYSSNTENHLHGYPSSNFSAFPSTSRELIPSGGSGIALREIQGFADVIPEPSIGDYDRAEVKLEHTSYDAEDSFCYSKIDTTRDNFGEDSGLGESVRDAESVQPYSKEDEDDAGSEYDPTTSTTQQKRPRRRSSHSSTTSVKVETKRTKARKSSTSSVVGSARVQKKTKASPGSAPVEGVERPFPCPFANYSCKSSFSSKNEWKRHVHTQHIKLGFWRCDLCPTTTDGSNVPSYNDFNRKDLFTQHLRRMHSTRDYVPKRRRDQSAPVKPPTDEHPVTEENLVDHQTRCYHRIREPPTQSSCLFCTKTFSGSGSWEDRMEHVGKHFEKEKKGVSDFLNASNWKTDPFLQDWLLTEGLIVRNARGGWDLGDGQPRRPPMANALRE